jgi:hypothetical protein
VQVIEKKSMNPLESFEREGLQVVWSSKSRNKGDQGVFFFDRGRISTAEKMASEMVDNVIREMREKQD